MVDLDELRHRWKYLYAEYLPTLARAKDPVQPKWPVNLDHCFARIVLDNALGIDRPWTEVVRSPAVKHMSGDQFRSAIALAERIASGEVDLGGLDERSLEVRGKRSKVGADGKGGGDERSLKRKAERKDAGTAKRRTKKGDETISSYFLPSPSSTSPKKEAGGTEGENIDNDPAAATSPKTESEDMSLQLQRIKTSNLTPFRKLTLSLLCGIPRGRYSTYQAMADHISATSHKTCARAVGNAMRNNPFAPEVPCHRILAADGSLGGFNGHWGEQGKFAGEKRELLGEEGVRFDSRGKVKGPVFRGWKGDGG